MNDPANFRQKFTKLHYANCECSIVLSLCKTYAYRLPTGLGKRSVTADTALRLGRYFHMSPQFWLGLQMDYDLDVTADALANRLNREVKPHALAA